MLVLVFIYLCLKVLKMCINACNLEEESIIIKKNAGKKQEKQSKFQNNFDRCDDRHSWLHVFA